MYAKLKTLSLFFLPFFLIASELELLHYKTKTYNITWNYQRSVYVVVNFLFQLIFIFPLFWGMVMYANEFKTKEKQKLTEIKN